MKNTVKLKDIVKFLDHYLKVNEIKDESWNGLQVEGKPEIDKVVFTENASLFTFKKAVGEKADLIVVHHGHFWKTGNPSFVDYGKERVGFLFKNGISLYASHLPLDRHREVGNNAQLLKLLGATIKAEFLMEEGKNIGWIGEFKKPAPVKEIEKTLNSELKTKCRSLLFGRENIKTVAVCSGGGGYTAFYEALSQKVDLYLTGDTIEVYNAAKDAKFNVIFAGHYATEILGIRALMEVIRKKFKVEALFIDDPTGL